jgi:cobalt-zinc-cadmium efflux system membrane fusion protein
MKIPKRIILPSLALAIIPLLPGCGPAAEEAASVEKVNEDRILELSPDAVSNLGLELVLIQPGQLQERMQLQGEIVLDESHMALVPSRLPGIVREIPVEVGQEVAQGDTLTILTSQELADRIMGYVGTEWAFRGAMEMIKRERALGEREISSEEQLLAAEQSYRQAETEHSVALQRMRALGYTEPMLHKYLERPDLQDLTLYSIKAPISGRVISRNLQKGAAVEPGRVLFRIADLRQLWLRFNLPLRYLGAVGSDLAIKVVNEIAGVEGEARISVIEDVMDSRSRTTPVRATLPNPEGHWRPGMPARVEIDGIPTEVERIIPMVAVQTLEGRPVVFVETAPGMFKPQPVTLGRKDASRAELLEGPPIGAKVAAKNSFLLLNAWQGEE